MYDDEEDDEWGYCNSCFEDRRLTETCCDDGEVVRPEGQPEGY